MSTELEKMLSGELYIATDPTLTEMRKRARRLTKKFNDTGVDDSALREELLKELFGTIGPRTIIEPPFHVDYGTFIHAGSDLFMNFGCVILDCAEVFIGHHVFMGPNVQIYTATHPLDADLRSSGPEAAKTIRIGNQVWIGGSAILCPGVTIGDNTTIGAGSVVTQDIPANVFAAGNPCRVIREL